MARIKLEFPNEEGHTLAGLLETPPGHIPIARYALFAHCFTCGKDIATASRISRALASRGIAVLRFDFTGLGNSDGDFANTNFSSNVQDIVSAARKLQEQYLAPALLIGHSLGGAAVLAAAPQLPAVEAVVTIGAPATAQHVEHLLVDARRELDTIGEAAVHIGLRQFRIKKQLLDDLARYGSASSLRDLKRALLIFHSPVDEVVSIDEAGKIYQSARHPKSFISLDRADHLLSNRDDAEYVAATLVSWASRYLGLSRHEIDHSYGTAPAVAPGDVLVTELNKTFLRGIYTHRHQWMADEPGAAGGGDLGPSPYDLLLMALGACTSMTLRLYANHKELPVDDIEIRLTHERLHADDCANCEQGESKIERITRRLKVTGDLTEEQRARLLQIADRCPVHRTLEAHPKVVNELEWEPG